MCAKPKPLRTTVTLTLTLTPPLALTLIDEHARLAILRVTNLVGVRDRGGGWVRVRMRVGLG